MPLCGYHLLHAKGAASSGKADSHCLGGKLDACVRRRWTTGVGPALHLLGVEAALCKCAGACVRARRVLLWASGA